MAGGLLFRRVVSPFHKLDPRVKLMISLELFVLSLVASSLIAVGLVIAAIGLIALVAKSLKRVGRTVVFSLLFTAFIFAVNMLLGLGLLRSFTYALRFVAIVGSTSIFFVTTSPDELEQIMKWMRIPRDVVFAFVTAVRFIPVVMLDAFQIIDAQKSRGLELEKGNLIARVRNMVPILIPLVVNSVIRSGELAEAMESRGYGSTPKPTSLYGMRLKWYDIAVLLGCACALRPRTVYLPLLPVPILMIPPRVVVDERERGSGVPDLLSKLGVRVYFSRLPIADYVVSPEIAAERKSLPDFVSSVYDGRLFIQASEISTAFRKPYIIVEGDVGRIASLVRNVSTYYGAIASVTLAYDLRLIHTANQGETAEALAALTRQTRARPLPFGAFSAPPKGKDEPQQQLYLVSSLPGVGTKLAKRMLGRFGTPRKIMGLTESQLSMVPGLGNKRAARIAHMLDTLYSGQSEGAPKQEKLGNE